MKHYIIFALIVAVAGCSNPKATIVPTSLEKMESIKPVIDKLSPDDKELFGKYVVRHTVGYAMSGMFGIKSDPIPEGITIGKAIEEQREFAEKQAAAEKEEKALQAKLAGEQEKAMDAMRQAVSVTIMGKKIKTEYGSSGIVMDELLSVKFGYKNNTDKEISGVKGTIEVSDQFGDPLTAFNVSNDESIGPGHVVVWSGGRSVRYGLSEDKDRKFAALPDEKYRIIWKPRMINFADGTKMAAPSLTD